MRKTKMEKGITLIALVITIVVLLILAMVAIKSITNDGILGKAQNAAKTYNESVQNEQKTLGIYEEYLNNHISGGSSSGENTGDEGASGGNSSSGEGTGDEGLVGIEIPTTGTWTQNKTSVTNGTVTLEVGTTVTGYTSPAGPSDPGWGVLGAENGKLLLVSKSNVGYVTLSGRDGYNNGIAKLDEICAPYLNSTLADEARSINIEDINRLTDYAPTNYGTTVTYAFKDGKVVYSIDGGDSVDTDLTSFMHVDGSSLNADEVFELANTAYFYDDDQAAWLWVIGKNGRRLVVDLPGMLVRHACGARGRAAARGGVFSV